MLKGVRYGAPVRFGTGHAMAAIAANMVLIFGNICEMRKVAKRPNYRYSVRWRQIEQDFFEVSQRLGVIKPMQLNGRATNGFYNVKNFRPFLVPDSIAQNAAKPTDVVTQRLVFV
jgi:hypothetical protein